MSKHYPEVFGTDDDRDDYPQDKEAVIPQMSSKNQQQSTANSKEPIKYSIFNYWTNANIFIIAFRPKIFIKCTNGCSILDYVENCSNDGND